MQTSPARFERLAALRAEVRAILCSGSERSEALLPFGIEAIDRRLAGGGLAAAALHEVAGAAPGLGDDAAATLFAAGIAARLTNMVPAGTVLWAMSRPDLFAPGLALAGLGPEHILYAECGRDDSDLDEHHGGRVCGGSDLACPQAHRHAGIAP